ncbi:MAG: NAD-dependent epimerase/dehydratase family protein [Azospirillum sp.]|nr:NAD-dependent epimerase/dehydratase family protein [Azospirillum sp.]
MRDRLMPPRRVVITGGAGFIGSHLAEALLTGGCGVHVLDDLSAGRRDNLPAASPGLTFDQVDVTDPIVGRRRLSEAVAEADLVFHLASPIGVQRALAHRYDVCTSILAAGLAVADACRTHRKPVLVSSSSEIYGTGSPEPLRETDSANLPTDPRWGYGAAKFALEHLFLGLTQETRVPAWIVRFFNIAGARQRFNTGLCIASFVRCAMEGRPLTIYGDGEGARAFLHVADAVAALLTIIDAPELVARPVNVGGTTTYSIRRVADEVVRIVNPATSIRHLDPRSVFGPGYTDAPIRIPNLGLILHATDWRPGRSLADMVTDCWQSYLAVEAPA